MEKIVKIVIFILIAVIQNLFLGNYIIKFDLLTNLFTFLSILFGFYVTSLAIFVTSKYVSSLYKVINEKNRSETLLHSLLNNYKNGLLLILFFIAYLILIMFVLMQDSEEIILLSNWTISLLLPLIIYVFIHGYNMLNDLIKIILQEAKTSRK